MSLVTPALPGSSWTGPVPADAASKACEYCGGPPSRIVPLVEHDMSAGRHSLCERCWTSLLAGLTRQRPWLHVGDDAETLYVTADLAWALISDPAGADSG